MADESALVDCVLKSLDKHGYAVVPKEPTQEMIDAGVGHIRGYHGYEAIAFSRQTALEAWKAMLEAAPK